MEMKIREKEKISPLMNVIKVKLVNLSIRGCCFIVNCHLCGAKWGPPLGASSMVLVFWACSAVVGYHGPRPCQKLVFIKLIFS